MCMSLKADIYKGETYDTNDRQIVFVFLTISFFKKEREKDWWSLIFFNTFKSSICLHTLNLFPNASKTLALASTEDKMNQLICTDTSTDMLHHLRW